MGAVPAGSIAPPEAAHHLLTGNAAPQIGEVPFIAAFVNDHRLLVFPDPTGDLRQGFGLQAGMGDVGARVIPEAHAVVVRQQMMIRVVVRHVFLDFLPVGQGFNIHVDVVLVGQAPPDIRLGGKAAEQVIQVFQVVLLRQSGK